MTPSESIFDELESTLAAQGAAAACTRLADHLRGTGQYHELFDARLMQARHELGLPIVPSGTLDDLPEPARTRMEEKYLEACREVGGLLLDAGRVREAWMYLRPVGEKADVALALEKLRERETAKAAGKAEEQATAEQESAVQESMDQEFAEQAFSEQAPAGPSVVEQIIEVALYEGVCPRLGFELVLENYGTCNAISLFDAQMHGRPPADKQAVAGVLVRHLHEELLRNLRADIARREGARREGARREGARREGARREGARHEGHEPAAVLLHELVSGRPDLFEGDNYHVDTTHLAAVVRFALACEDPATLRLALDLTEYGRRLSTQYQFAGQEPFGDTYPAHAQFFRGLLGERADEAVAYFRQRADELAESDRMGQTNNAAVAGEVLVGLLARMGRTAEALEESASRLAAGGRNSGFAPGLMELAARAQRYDRLQQISREHEDAVGFTAGLLGGFTRQGGTL